MKVVCYKTSDGKLFEDYKEFENHEENLKLGQTIKTSKFNTSNFYRVEGYLVLGEDDLPEFIKANKNVLRALLNPAIEAKPKKRSIKK